MMTQPELQTLRDLGINEIAERLNISVSRGRFLCPAHPDHSPSASITRSGKRWKCWSCGAGSNAIDLTMFALSKSFTEAVDWLSNGQSLPLTERTVSSPKPAVTSFDPLRYARFFEHPWLSPEAQRFLFEERRLDPRVVSWCRLTSWQDRNGVPWLQIPYFDMDGRLIGVQNRNLAYPQPLPKGRGAEPAGGYCASGASGGAHTPPFSEGLGVAPRFRFPYGSRCSIYNLPILRYLKEGEECWIAEGSSDCWSHLSSHHKAISIPSATLLGERDKELLQRVTVELRVRWRMAPDADEPGHRLAAQLREILPRLEIVELEEGCKDYSEQYVRALSRREVTL